MSDVRPAAVLEQVAASVPGECRSRITVIGSLAAGYQLFAGREELYVRTKDIDTPFGISCARIEMMALANRTFGRLARHRGATCN
jgi:hypothetical protein